MKKVKRTFKRKDYISGDGMVTTIWGPGMWHFLHTISFNYPIHPTHEDKIHYTSFIENLQYILPCKYCRQNLRRNLQLMPITSKVMESRDSFSRYIYNLHETVNKLLNKKSGLSYYDVRERYEHFRSRCTQDSKEPIDKIKPMKKTRKNKKENEPEKGCTEPLYGQKAKAVIQIVPKSKVCDTLQIDERCLKEHKSTKIYKS
jgi:Erv1 / Alr family